MIVWGSTILSSQSPQPVVPSENHAGKSGVRVCVRSTVRLNVILGRDVGADCADAAFEIPPSPAAAAQLPAAVFKKRRRPATIRSTSAMMNGEHMMGSPFTRRGSGRTIHRPAERRYTNAKSRKKVVSRTESLLLTASGQFARPRTAQTATADPATEPQSDIPGQAMTLPAIPLTRSIQTGLSARQHRQ